MKLLGAKLRGIFAKFFEALQPSFAKATEGSPHLHPRSKLRGIRRRRIKLWEQKDNLNPRSRLTTAGTLLARLPPVIRRNVQILSDINVMRIRHRGSIGFIDFDPLLARVVKLLRYSAQVISGRYDIRSGCGCLCR